MTSFGGARPKGNDRLSYVGCSAPDSNRHGGEIAVVRHDGDKAKAYNFIFGTSSNGLAYFNGPHKDFPSHHFATSAPVPVESLFGHPLSNEEKT